MESNNENKYPYPEISALLRIQSSPDEYKKLGYSYKNQNGLDPREDPEYLKIIPVYTYARCPICQTICTASIDTYNLFRLGFLSTKYSLDGRYILPPDYPKRHNPPCEHFLGTHSFRNLHGLNPIELSQQTTNPLQFYGEVPCITPWFLRDDVESYVVLHALPCCRIEKGSFVPAYTLFILTYFSVQPRLLIDLHYSNEFETMAKDTEYYPVNVLESFVGAYQDKSDEFNLSLWAAKGKLGYLDYRDTNLPLSIGKATLLPEIYKDIKGKTRRMTWKEGRFVRW